MPQVFVDVDREKVLKQDVELSAVYQTLQCFMGGDFVNYFNRFGRQWQVYIQAEGDYRRNAENIGQFYVKNNGGTMVPFSARRKFETDQRPRIHHALQPLSLGADQCAARRPAISSAQAMKALEEVFAETMPSEMGYAYIGMSLPGKTAQEGVSAGVIFALSLLFVFLILAAQYESWSLPFSVLLSVPVAVFGAFAGLTGRPLSRTTSTRRSAWSC